MGTEKIEIRPFIICTATVVFTEVIAQGLIGKAHVDPLWALGAVRLFETMLLITILMVWGNGLASVGLARDQWKPGVKTGLIWSAGFGLLTLLGFALLFVLGINPLSLLKTPLPSNPSHLIPLFIVGGVVGPVTEEIFFRGIVYGFLRRWGMLTALIFSTLLFVLPHMAGNSMPLTQAVGGLLFALGYEFGHSLMVPISIHILGNLALFTLSWITP